MDLGLDNLFGKLKHEAVKLKREAKRVTELETPLERNLREATSNKNWGCPNSVLYELAADASNYHDRQKILSTVSEKLQRSPDKWRCILKTLTLLEHLIKNGPEQMIVELQGMMSMVRRLGNFEAHEDGRERGGAVREKAKALVEIMGDNAKLRAERDAAKEHRTKFMSGGGGRESRERDSSYGQSGMGSEPSRGGSETRGSLEDRFQELKKKQQQEQASKTREREERMAKTRDSGDRRRDEDDDRGRERDNDRDRGERRRHDSPDDRRRRDDSDSPRDRNYAKFDQSRGGGRSDDDSDLVDDKPRAKPAGAAPPMDNLLDLMDSDPAPSAPSSGFAPAPAASQGFNDDFGDFSSSAAAPAPATNFGADFGDFSAAAAPAAAAPAVDLFSPNAPAATAAASAAPMAAPAAPVFGGAPMGGMQMPSPMGAMQMPAPMGGMQMASPMGGGYGAQPAPAAPTMGMNGASPMMGMGAGMMASPSTEAPASQPAPAPAAAPVANDTFLSGISSNLYNLDIGSGTGPPTAPPDFAAAAAAAAAPAPEKKSDPAALDSLNAFGAFS